MSTGASDAAAAPGGTLVIEDVLGNAEDSLQRGLVEDASRLARTVLLRPLVSTQDKARAISVLVQADFHFRNQLTDLETLLQQSGLALEQLPVTAVLLWGVVAVELAEADVARGLLRRYLDTKNFGEESDVNREDALALSRLYAVQLLSGLCGDFQAAAEWLADGGAGLSEEQQELLLLEVDEAEELAQEEHVAVWTSQDAAQAAHLGPHAHLNHSASAGEHGGESDTAQEGGATDTASVVGSAASTAAAALQELGPSVSGVLSTASLSYADEASHEHDSGSGVGHELATDAAPSRTSQGSNGDSSTHRQTPAAVAAAAGAQLQAAVAAVAAAEARLGSVSSPLPSPAALAPAAVAVHGLEDSERVPSSPSLASWRRSPDEVAVQDQEGSSKGGSDSPYVTITGAFSDQGCNPEAITDSAAAAGVGSRPGGSQGGSPQKGKLARLSNSSSSRSRLRDAASDIAAAAVAAVATAVENGHAAAAAVVGATQNAAAAADASQQEQQQAEDEDAAADPGQEQKQPPQSWVQSYASWATDKASETWQSQSVQDTLKAFNVQDMPPWELASGAAAAVLLTYGLYRNRRRVKRAAKDFVAGVAQTAQMALGMSVNPMAAVPGTAHIMR